MALSLGTRGSALALWQAERVAARLREAHPGLSVAVTVIRTEGDRKADVPLTASGGKGVFVKEIEDALASGKIDLAVHSLKDLPTDTPDGLVLAAIPERADPRDVIVSPKASALDDLPRGALVATGSPRRRSQLAHARPDLRFTLVRGNVDTRVRKLNEGAFEALILAAAGLTRLGVDAAPWTPIPAEICLPAPGQGALAIETRSDDAATIRLVSALDDSVARAAVGAERAFLAELGAGCLAPAGALATVSGGTLDVAAMVASLDGRAVRRERVSGPSGDAEALGRAVARRILDDGGEAILREARSDEAPS